MKAALKGISHSSVCINSFGVPYAHLPTYFEDKLGSFYTAAGLAEWEWLSEEEEEEEKEEGEEEVPPSCPQSLPDSRLEGVLLRIIATQSFRCKTWLQKNQSQNFQFFLWGWDVSDRCPSREIIWLGFPTVWFHPRSQMGSWVHLGNLVPFHIHLSTLSWSGWVNCIWRDSEHCDVALYCTDEPDVALDFWAPQKWDLCYVWRMLGSTQTTSGPLRGTIVSGQQQ